LPTQFFLKKIVIKKNNPVGLWELKMDIIIRHGTECLIALLRKVQGKKITTQEEEWAEEGAKHLELERQAMCSYDPGA